MPDKDIQTRGSRYPDPDDAELRVLLTEDVRSGLAHLPRKEVAALIRSSHAGKESVAPSTVSCIVHGTSNPTRRVARKIASLLKRDPLEVETGLEQPYPSSVWGAHIIYKSGGFRERVFRLFKQLSPFLDANVHFGSPTDADRPHRHVLYAARPEFEYQVFQLGLPPKRSETAGFDLVLSNRIHSSPRIQLVQGD
jgi:hypothetical protein